MNTEIENTSLQLFEMTRNLLMTYNTPISAVYLIELGYVRDLRQEFIINNDIPDESVVFKYGRTDDIGRRFTEHYKYYQRYRLCDAKLIKYTKINYLDLAKTESSLKDCFRKQGFTIRIGADVRGKTELIAVSSSQLIEVYNEFSVVFTVLDPSIEELVIHNKQSHFHNHSSLETIEPENEIIQETEGLRKEITAPEKLNYGRIIADLRYEYEKTIIELKLKSKDLEIENLKLRLKFSTHKF